MLCVHLLNINIEECIPLQLIKDLAPPPHCNVLVVIITFSLDSAGTILSSSICLPLSREARSSRSHIATNLLSCLSILATHSPVTIETLAGSSLHKFDKDEFNCVVRFNGM